MAWLVFSLNYNEFTYALLIGFDKLDKLELFRENLLTVNKFLILKVVVAVILISIVLCAKMIVNLLSMILDNGKLFFIDLRYTVVALWNSLTISQRRVFLFSMVLLVGFKTLLCYLLPLHIDELFSFVHLSSKGFFLTSTYYPGPNNHVFYNQLVAIGYALHLPALLAIRLPSIFAGVFLFVILFFYGLYRFNFSFAFLISMFVSFSINVMSFTVQGRGYGLQLLCLAIAIVSLFEWLQYGSKKHVSTLFVLFSILGFYANPTYLYPFTSLLVLVIVISPVKEYRKLFVVLILICSGVFMVYTPLLFANGFNALVNNAWVKPLETGELLREFPAYLMQLNAYWWNLNATISLYLTISFVSICFLIKPMRKWLWFVIVPITMFVIQGVLPYYRVFTFQSAFLWAGVGFVFYLVHKKIAVHGFEIGVVSLFVVLNIFVWVQTIHAPITEYDKQINQIIYSMPRNTTLNLLVLDEKLALKLNYLKITNPAYKHISVDYSLVKHKKYDKIFPVILAQKK